MSTRRPLHIKSPPPSDPTTSRAYAAMPPSNTPMEFGRLSTSRLAKKAPAFSHRTPPVQYSNTLLFLNQVPSPSQSLLIHSASCENRRIGAFTAPRKYPTLLSYQFRTSRITVRWVSSLSCFVLWVVVGVLVSPPPSPSPSLFFTSRRETTFAASA